MLRDLAEAPEVQSDGAIATGKTYRFRRLALRTVLGDMCFEASAPRPGDPVPAFDLSTVDGGRIQSSDLPEISPILVVFGSLSCPMTDSALPGLLALHRRHGELFHFLLVNVREAHPGSSLPQPQTAEEKLARAQVLGELHALPFEVAVDDVDGTFHRAMSPKPNAAYLIGQDGRIAFRAHWANDTASLGRALEQMVTGRAPDPRQSGGLFVPMLRMLPDLAPVLDRAGAGAWRDMWRVMPQLAVAAKVMQLIGLARPPKAMSRAVRRHGQDAFPQCLP